MNLEEVKDFLPESVTLIVSLIGFEATAKLIKRLGGINFPFGKGESARGERRIKLLKEVLGEENANIIIRHFGGEYLFIPKCDRALREWRNRQFVAELDMLTNDGLSTKEAIETLCPKYGFTERIAWMIIRKIRYGSDIGEQGALF